MLEASSQPVTGSDAGRSERQSTPGRLRRRFVMMLVATVVLWVTATVIVLALNGTVQSVRGSASPAYLNVLGAPGTGAGHGLSACFKHRRSCRRRRRFHLLTT